mmetsp:Transcript_7205/g.18607  ORF Transcript_7205/g.18607 Transcript_7205/m.18607 type:complete len:365 (+) Transcript_7205:240-1334(+)
MQQPIPLALPRHVAQTGSGSYQPHSRRGFSAQMVLVLCVASYLVGRYVELFVDLEALPAAKGPTVVEVKQPDSADLRRRVELEHPQEVQHEVAHQPSSLQAAREGSGLTLQLPDRVQQSDIQQLSSRHFLADEPPREPTASGSAGYNTMPFQVLSWYPRIVLFPKFLDHDKCDHVVEIGKKKLHGSSLSLRKGETVEGTRDIRTSSGTFLSRGSDPKGVLAEVEDRIAAWTSVPAGHGEPFNLLRYEQGQHYDSHYDVFDETYGPQQSQRMATVLVYLSTVEEGGETVFPLEGEDGMQRLRGIDYKSCDMGFKYKPVKGDAVLFYSLHPNGTIDKHSLHGGCPVHKGEKWVMTKWIRDKCFGRC